MLQLDALALRVQTPQCQCKSTDAPALKAGSSPTINAPGLFMHVPCKISSLKRGLSGGITKHCWPKKSIRKPLTRKDFCKEVFGFSQGIKTKDENLRIA